MEPHAWQHAHGRRAGFACSGGGTAGRPRRGGGDVDVAGASVGTAYESIVEGSAEGSQASV